MLKGIKVVDLTRILAGPYCTMVLSDLGAEIIKVETPKGDDSRQFGPFIKGKSGYFTSLNREKKSIVINLKTEEGKEILKKIVKEADILVENFKPGTMKKLGLGYEELKKINPKLIYTSISGFGHTGPYTEKPAYDIIVQAAGGIMSITGEEGGKPVRVGASIGDITSSLFTTTAITTALFNRQKTGKGQRIDISMLDCQVAILENAIIRHEATGKNPKPLGTRHPSIAPFQGYKTKDGWIIIATGNNKLWEKFCKIIKPELDKEEYNSNNKRVQKIKELNSELQPILKEKNTKEWIKILEKEKIPCGPINTMKDLMEHEQIKARNMLVKLGNIKIAGNPIKMTELKERENREKAPELGEHTEELLEKLGYKKEEIKKMKEKEIIK